MIHSNQSQPVISQLKDNGIINRYSLGVQSFLVIIINVFQTLIAFSIAFTLTISRVTNYSLHSLQLKTFFQFIFMRSTIQGMPSNDSIQTFINILIFIESYLQNNDYLLRNMTSNYFMITFKIQISNIELK